MASSLSRREFLVRSGAVGAVAALAQVPALLKLRGWYDPAYAQEDNPLVVDTLNGLVAFIAPGDDPYSVAQGDATERPGGIAADTTPILIQSLDFFLPNPDVPNTPPNDETVALSASIANLLNVVALTVDPTAAVGAQFLTPFPRLSSAEKAAVFERLEADNGVPDGLLPQPFTQATGNFRFVAGILPGFVAFLAFTEWQKFDPETKTLTGLPVGWEMSGYVSPVEGWDEFRGYYRDRTRADA